MARRSKSGRRTRKHRGGSQCGTRLNVGQTGGGWGFTGASSIPGTPGTVSNPQVFTGIGDCRAVEPGYTIPTSNYGSYLKGLPGMNGGKRRKSRRGKGRKTRKQRGGRYGFFPEGDPNPNGQLYYAGSYAPVQRIACEGTSPNPLNPTHTGSSAPPGAANPNYWMAQRGGSMAATSQRGGAQNMAPATYGVGNVDSMYYYAPTAGYANTASAWKDSVGAPVQIQVPYAAREMNQACLTTGGPPPLTGALQKGGKRNRTRRGGGFFNTVKDFVSRQTNTVKSKLGLASQPAVNTSTYGTNMAVSLNQGPVETGNSGVSSPPPPPSSPINLGPAMGGRRRHKRRHGKKRTHKRKH